MSSFTGGQPAKLDPVSEDMAASGAEDPQQDLLGLLARDEAA
jgi:hypothetical protein